MDPVYYLTMISVVLAELLIFMYLLRPQWLHESRRWRLACLYGVYLCACCVLVMPEATGAYKGDRTDTQKPAVPASPSYSPLVDYT
jgi:hypothetical protein